MALDLSENGSAETMYDNIIVQRHSDKYFHITFRVFQLTELNKLECGPMPNVMVALRSTPQSLADAHYLTGVQ